MFYKGKVHNNDGEIMDVTVEHIVFYKGKVHNNNGEIVDVTVERGRRRNIMRETDSRRPTLGD